MVIQTAVPSASGAGLTIPSVTGNQQPQVFNLVPAGTILAHHPLPGTQGGAPTATVTTASASYSTPLGGGETADNVVVGSTELSLAKLKIDELRIALSNAQVTANMSQEQIARLRQDVNNQIVVTTGKQQALDVMQKDVEQQQNSYQVLLREAEKWKTGETRLRERVLQLESELEKEREKVKDKNYSSSKIGGSRGEEYKNRGGVDKWVQVTTDGSTQLTAMKLGMEAMPTTRPIQCKILGSRNSMMLELFGLKASKQGDDIAPDQYVSMSNPENGPVLLSGGGVSSLVGAGPLLSGDSSEAQKALRKVEASSSSSALIAGMGHSSAAGAGAESLRHKPAVYTIYQQPKSSSPSFASSSLHQRSVPQPRKAPSPVNADSHPQLQRFNDYNSSHHQ